MRGVSVPGMVLGVALIAAVSGAVRAGSPPSEADVRSAFARQGIRIDVAEAGAIRGDVGLALEEAGRHGIGDSKVDFAAVEIAHRLGLDPSAGSSTVRNVVAAIRELFEGGFVGVTPARPPRPALEWKGYFDRTLGLWNDGGFLGLVREKGFHPVKISWEDIGRYQGSVWGDRISDVGIWVREDEADPASARLALSVRRDGNFRDKVLVVPASAIKVHQRLRGRTVERTLPERLEVLWKFSVKGGFDATAVIADGVVYAGSASDKLYAIELAKGQSLWEYPTGAGFTAAAAVRGGKDGVGLRRRKLLGLDGEGPPAGEEKPHLVVARKVCGAPGTTTSDTNANTDTRAITQNRIHRPSGTARRPSPTK